MDISVEKIRAQQRARTHFKTSFLALTRLLRYTRNDSIEMTCRETHEAVRKLGRMERVVPGERDSLEKIQMNQARECARRGVFEPIDLVAERRKMDRMVVEAISPSGILGRIGGFVCRHL